MPQLLFKAENCQELYSFEKVAKDVKIKKALQKQDQFIFLKHLSFGLAQAEFYNRQEKMVKDIHLP